MKFIYEFNSSKNMKNCDIYSLPSKSLYQHLVSTKKEKKINKLYLITGTTSNSHPKF